MILYVLFTKIAPNSLFNWGQGDVGIGGSWYCNGRDAVVTFYIGRPTVVSYVRYVCLLAGYVVLSKSGF